MAGKKQVKDEKKLTEEAIIATLKGLAMLHWVMGEFTINPELMGEKMRELIEKHWIDTMEDGTVKIDSTMYESIAKIALELFTVAQ